MNRQLKRAIVNYVLDNLNEQQLTNATMAKFKRYIYDEHGEYLMGGEEVAGFIHKAVGLR